MVFTYVKHIFNSQSLKNIQINSRISWRNVWSLFFKYCIWPPLAWGTARFYLAILRIRVFNPSWGISLYSSLGAVRSCKSSGTNYKTLRVFFGVGHMTVQLGSGLAHADSLIFVEPATCGRALPWSNNTQLVQYFLILFS